MNSYPDFWIWFQSRKKDFFNVVKTRGDFEKDFFQPLAEQLSQLHDGYYFLTGMPNETTVELIFTADGKVRNFIFIEELVQAAPQITGWKFIAHKPTLDIKDVNITGNGFEFNKDNLSFEAVLHPLHPDIIEITVVHSLLNEENRKQIENGVCIFLDNYLGEIDCATTIDYLNVDAKNGRKELIPIEKLKDYLSWREKEFIEKYENLSHNTTNERFGGFEGFYENGAPSIAIMNTDLLSWEGKASHPWILKIEIEYGDMATMPDEAICTVMDKFEDGLLAGLKDLDGYLNIGRETGNGLREIFFACKDFRKSSKVTSELIEKYADKLSITYDIYKDKYWKTFERYNL